MPRYPNRMRFAFLLFLMVHISSPVAADDRAMFFGNWGTPKQCARAAIKPGGTVMAAPFVIGADWLRHGRIWCRLRWGLVAPRDDGYFASANAQCGEDSVREYFLGLILSGDELTLRWDSARINGPLPRCSAS